MEVVKKVLAYIYRNPEEVLVFNHLLYPEVSPQVICGTVEESEGLEEAVLREIFEESGLRLKNPALLKTASYIRKDLNQLHERNIFELFDVNLPDKWKHVVSSGEEDQGMEFEFYWLSTNEAKLKLVGEMGLYL